MSSPKPPVKPMSPEQRCILLFNTIVNTIISCFLIATFILVWFMLGDEWQFFFFLTLITLLMNTVYIVSCTIIDWLIFLNKVYLKNFENNIRNIYWKYCFSYAIAVVIVYWELCLLGYDFQPLGPEVIDYTVSFYLHGMGLVFLCFDTFASRHIDKTSPLIDFFVMSGFYIFYAFLLVMAKYVIKFDVYPFMMLVNNRQMTAAGSLIYFICLLSYVGSYIIAKIFFVKEKSEDETDKPKDVLIERKNVYSQQLTSNNI